MSTEIIIKELEIALKMAIGALTQEIAGIRSNRPSPALVEDLKIDYMGSVVVIKQLGSISVVPPRELVISLWDPSQVATVAKAIEDSKRGFTPAVRGSAIHINLPALSQERREELIKILKSITEKFRINIRSVRDEAIKKLTVAETAKTIDEDQKFRGKKKIQELVDKANADIETMLTKKEKEINE